MKKRRMYRDTCNKGVLSHVWPQRNVLQQGVKYKIDMHGYTNIVVLGDNHSLLFRAINIFYEADCIFHAVSVCQH